MNRLIILLLFFVSLACKETKNTPSVSPETAAAPEASLEEIPIVLPDSAPQIVLACSEWPPYTSEKLPNKGLHCYLVKKALARAGILVKFNFYPTWSRVMAEAKAGHVHGLMYMAANAERLQDFYPSDPVCREIRYCISLKSKPFIWHQLNELQNIELAIMAGYFYGEEFNKLKEQGKLKLQEVRVEEQALFKVLNGHVQAFPASLLVANSVISRNTDLSNEQFSYHPRPFQVLEHRLMFSRKRPDSRQLAETFNKAWSELKSELGEKLLLEPAASHELTELSERERAFFLTLRPLQGIKPSKQEISK